jgi:hypothetical protein
VCVYVCVEDVDLQDKAFSVVTEHIFFHVRILSALQTTQASI